ncbi:MAG: hypothetical protein LBQ82_08940 [Treponema sp.]|jgi:hypothetical protein|nr:hypothetical protein [Treponema sp.]
MAPAKKAATTKAAAKTAKPKAAAKKPDAKKTAAKKPAAKTAPAKKPAVKKTAAKATATVKKPAAKKPAAKDTAAKKPSAKKAEVKTAAVKKTAVKKPEAKPAVEKKAEALESNVKYRSLFDAYRMQKLPLAHGYIVSSFFNEKNAYSIYEIVSYAGVKEIYPAGTDLTFIAGGKKLHVLVEHDTYHKRHVEPLHRDKGESIPKRQSELEVIIAKNQSRIMVAKEPDEINSSFTIIKPSSLNFAVVFYQLPDVYQSLAEFFEKSLNRERKVPQSDAKKAANLIAATVEKTMGFKGESE